LHPTFYVIDTDYQLLFSTDCALIEYGAMLSTPPASLLISALAVVADAEFR
jgi:hypothetical protein